MFPSEAIEFHDSELVAIEHDLQGNGILLLDSYVHRQSRSEGGMRKVRIVIDSMTLSGDIGPLPATLYRESLHVNGSTLNGLLSLPSAYEGALSLNLVLLDWPAEISIAGKRLSITPDGDFRFVERLN